MSRGFHRQGGYMLLEMLAYIAIMAVAVNLCAGLFISGIKLSAYNSAALERIGALQELERGFVQQAQQATGVVEAAGPFVSGKDTLVLQLPDTPSRNPRYLALQWRKETGLVRSVTFEQDAGAYPILDARSYRVPLDTLEFGSRQQGTGAVMLSMTVTLAPLRKNSQREPVLHQVLATVRSRG